MLKNKKVVFNYKNDYYYILLDLQKLVHERELLLGDEPLNKNDLFSVKTYSKYESIKQRLDSETLPELFTICRDKWIKKTLLDSLVNDSKIAIRYLDKAIKSATEVTISPLIGHYDPTLPIKNQKEALAKGIIKIWWENPTFFNEQRLLNQKFKPYVNNFLVLPNVWFNTNLESFFDNFESLEFHKNLTIKTFDNAQKPANVYFLRFNSYNNI